MTNNLDHFFKVFLLYLDFAVERLSTTTLEAASFMLAVFTNSRELLAQARVLTLLIIFFDFTNAVSQEAIRAGAGENPIVSGPNIFVTTAPFNEAQVNSSLFHPIAYQQLKIGSAVTFRLVVRNEGSEPIARLFKVAHVDTCILLQNGRVYHSGFSIPYDKQPIKNATYNPNVAGFPLHVGANSSDTLLLHFPQGVTSENLILNMQRDATANPADYMGLVYIALVFSILLYHFLLFAITRTPIFASYSAYLFAIVLFILFYHREPGLVLLFDRFEFLHHITRYMLYCHIALSALTIYMHTTFIMAFFELKVRMFKWYVALNVGRILGLLLAAVACYIFWSTLNYQLVMGGIVSYTYLSLSLLVLAFIVGTFKKNFRFSVYSIIGLLWFYCIVFVNNFVQVDFLKPSFGTYFLGVSFELIFFALAIGDKNRETEREKRLAQSALISQLRVNEQLQSKVNRELEEKVDERTRVIKEQTEEIMAQNEELQQQGEELAAQRDKLSEQNRMLQQSQALIATHNEELENTVATRTRALAEKTEDLRQRIVQLEQFSFITAHNIRGPVARQLGLLQILNKTDIEPENLEILAHNESSAKILDRTIHELARILELQKGQRLPAVMTDLESFFKRELTAFESELNEAGAELDLDIKVKYWPIVPAYCQSIIYNLISNSIKYRNTELPLRIAISLESVADTNLKWTTTDNGTGFDTNLYGAKALEPFQRLHTNSRGSGLGLFLVKQQVEAMHGAIALQGRKGLGLSVAISLPKLAEQMT